MTLLATRFRDVRLVRAREPLTDDAIRRVAPSIFADSAHASRSERYGYIPTCDVLTGLRQEGFEPFMACQARTRDDGRQDYTKHMLRLRHADQINGEEANEIVLINSHDGSSSYQMLAGVYRFVCQNGMVCGETIEDLRIPHRGNVVGRVIEGAYRILGDFEQVDAAKDDMKRLNMTSEERTLLANAALTVRFEQNPPVTAEQVLKPQRSDDTASNLWTTFNVIQENLVRGGLRGQSPQGRRTHTRAVTGIDGNVRLNRALWMLAEKMRELKTH
jgi:hypothetical protein